MKQYILFIFIVSGAVWTGVAQTLLDPTAGTESVAPAADDESRLNIGLEQGKKADPAADEPVNIFTNRFGDVGVDEQAAPDRMEESKVGFLMSTGVEYADEGEYEAAEKAYLRAHEIDPMSEDVLFRLGTLYVGMGRFKDAAEIFEGLCERFPDNPMTHNNLAWCYAVGPRIKNKTLALRHAREAIILAPRESSIWNTLAEAYYAAGDYDKALRAAEHALELFAALNASQQPPEIFLIQRAKIIRAQEALKMLNGDD